MLFLPPYTDFEQASRATLAFLHQRLGFELWLMTRREGSDWIVLQAEDHGYNVEDGTVFHWADSFCSQMVQGNGPRIAPCSKSISAYAAAPIGQDIPIGAYIGVPIGKESGELFGTLCAIDPMPQKESILDELPLIELLSRHLGTILMSELAANEQRRFLKKAQHNAMTDILTGLLNRRGWEQKLEEEEVHAQRYGSPVCVVIVDLDGLKETNDSKGHAQGDILIQKAAQSLQSAVRDSDIIARTGGDEFGILAVECNVNDSEKLVQRIKEMLAFDGVSASVGMAMRDPKIGLLQAVTEADHNMYAEKTRRKQISKV